MEALKEVYITAAGKFLPGPPIPNDEMEDYLGRVNGKPSAVRRRILESNGIKTRHYAMDKNQQTVYQNSTMAALAVRDALGKSETDAHELDLLAVGTTQGDLPLPGMASMVQAELGLPPLEILTTHGVCCAGMTALKSAYNQVKLGEKSNAVAVASEFSSRLFKHTRFESYKKVSFETEFLRWMLSDGAGAFLLQPQPSRGELNLRIDWIELTSYASCYDLCMYAGTNKVDGKPGPGWQDYPTYEAAAAAGAIDIKQDIRLLDNIMKVGVDGFVRLIVGGRLDPARIDHVLCHYSSHFFRQRTLDMLRLAGCLVPEERWYTNLYERGNTGCASIYIMLEEFLNGTNRLQEGDTVLCVVPESGRFSCAYMHLTAVRG